MARYAIVTLKYIVPLERILQTTDRHRAFLRELHAQGKLVMSGPFEPRTGGALLMRASSEAEIRQILSADPFHQEALVETTVQLWAVNIGDAGLDLLAPVQKA